VLSIAQALGLNGVLLWIGERYYQGNSVVNWGFPNLIEGKENDVREVRQIADHLEDRPPFATFNGDIAKASLVLSASVYEAFPHWRSFVIRISNQDVRITQAREIHITEAGSYIRILFFRFPLAPSKVVISLIFKGTSPFQLSEWLTNLSMTKIEASEYLWGACHEGYYSKLFYPTLRHGNAYEKILDAIKEMMVREEDHQIQEQALEYSMFCTGHSLGGGLASLFYARLLKAPDDLLPLHRRLTFEGAYTFGAPRVGSFQFMRDLSGHANNPTKRFVICWRVVNALDLISDVPFGEDDLHAAFIKSSGDLQDILDFSHIGTLVHLRNSGKVGVGTGPFQVDSFESLLLWLMDRTGLGGLTEDIYDWFLSYRHLLRVLDLFSIFSGLVPLVGDHSPARYYLNLSNPKEGKTDKNE